MDTLNSELSNNLGPIDLDLIMDPNIKEIFIQEKQYVDSEEFRSRVDAEWESLIEMIKTSESSSEKLDLVEIFSPIVKEATDLLGEEPSPEIFETIAYDLMPIYYVFSNIQEISPNKFAMLGKMEGFKMSDLTSEIDLILNQIGFIISALFAGYDRGMQTVDINLIRDKFSKLINTSNNDDNRS